MKTIQKRDLGALDGLRVLATLAIFLYHAGILRQGSFPVTFFFMLSGFLLYYTKHTLMGYPSFRAWLGYVGKKLREFYPLHLLTFLYACILIRPEWNGERISSAAHSLLLLHAFREPFLFDFNGLAWYLSALIFLYLIGYFLIRLLNRYGKYRNCLIGMTLAMIGVCNGLLWMEIPVYLYGNPVYRILDFFLGMLMAHLFLEKQQETTGQSTANRRELVICAAFAVAYLLSLWLKPKCGYYSILFAAALTIFAKGQGCVSKVLRGRLFGAAAKCSFAFYMLHELVLRTLRQIIPPETMGHYPRIFLLTAIAFPITAVLAWAYNWATQKKRS
jgi:peptidoglycan/LPS O-acetylase OafA/YrhL